MKLKIEEKAKQHNTVACAIILQMKWRSFNFLKIDKIFTNMAIHCWALF